jgi:hypothetical protein
MYNIDLGCTQMSPCLEAMGRGSLCQIPGEGQGGRLVKLGQARASEKQECQKD